MDEIMQCLIDVNYPNIASMCDEDIVQLFDTENIQVFYRWFVSEMLTDKTMISSYKDDEIIEVIYNFGYCSKTQKEDLLKGTLDFEKQYKIIHRMLFNLSTIKNFEKKEAFHEPVTVECLEDFLSHGQELCSTLSLKGKFNQNKVDDRLTSLQQQIDELEDRVNLDSDICTDESTKKNADDGTTCLQKEEIDLSTVVNNFLLNISKINVDNTNTDSAGGAFSDRFSTVLEDCCSKVSKLEEYLTNLSILDEHNQQRRTTSILTPSECSKSVEKLLKLMKEL